MAYRQKNFTMQSLGWPWARSGAIIFFHLPIKNIVRAKRQLCGTSLCYVNSDSSELTFTFRSSLALFLNSLFYWFPVGIKGVLRFFLHYTQ
jgi:hypothetical protein